MNREDADKNAILRTLGTCAASEMDLAIRLAMAMKFIEAKSQKLEFREYLLAKHGDETLDKEGRAWAEEM